MAGIVSVEGGSVEVQERYPEACAKTWHRHERHTM